MGARDAVKNFMKKGFHIETARDAGKRKNLVYGRKVNVTALEKDDHVIVLLAAADPREGKVLVETKPADWDEKYATDYYKYNPVEGTLTLNTEADFDKVAGFIYK